MCRALLSKAAVQVTTVPEFASALADLKAFRHDPAWALVRTSFSSESVEKQFRATQLVEL